ncbi:lipid A ABC transporter ATP-binding protein/permease MsbA [Arsenophonus symbiont of Ornithomya chloropus]|uniref:lipid A ABC transporter ATP-binding protein/permease MsbA n=1 Tax=Arsenophonus symbiont of Ornithomya chloropus TaxID=634121 RepID=UPI0032B2CA44
MIIKEKKNSIWHTFRRLFPMILPFKVGLTVAVIALIINAIGDASMIALLKPLLDEGFGNADHTMLKWLSIAILGLMLIRGISSFISNYCMAWVSGKVVMNMRRCLFIHMMGMPIAFFDKQSTGTLLSRITYDSEQVASSSSGTLITIVRESSYIIGLFWLMFYHSWQLSLILIVISPIVAFIIRSISKHFRNISKNMQTDMGQITVSTEQMLKGHKEVLIFGGQKVEIERFRKVSNHMRHQTMKMVTISSIFDPIIQFIASLALAFTLYVSSFPEIMQTLTAGDVGVVFSSMFALMRPLKSLTNVNVQFQRGMVACQTLFTILDMEKEKDDGKLILKQPKNKIEFKNVTFRYSSKENPALYNISFAISVGKSIALVGRSGAGKSTIANLITRFYDVNKGQILLDNRDLREYTLRSLRSQIALVSQDVYLFNDTIANNIAYATDGIYSRKAIEKAAKMAYAMDFIQNLEHGLDTIIGENGVMLSGGQKQRIAIGRALLHDSSILIFDEATSALDTESEKAIQVALHELQKNKTFIIIAHRLSTIEHVDEILVMQEGKIIEQGNHHTLLKCDGVYSHLYGMQFKL